MKKHLGSTLVCAAFLLAPSVTRAQDAPPEGEIAPVSESEGAAPAPHEPPEPIVAVAAAPEAQPATATDGVRFRGAIAASGGGEFASGFAVGMAGLEGRVGIQISNLIGIYLQPSLSLGAGTVNGGTVTVFTGTAGISALIDFTIEDHFFVGVGGGVGILNNPIAPEIHLRVGGYPVVVTGQDGYSRQALVVGVDARLFLLPSFNDLLPVTQILASIGYEVL